MEGVCRGWGVGGDEMAGCTGDPRGSRRSLKPNLATAGEREVWADTVDI